MLRDLILIGLGLPVIGVACIGVIVLVSYVVNYFKTKEWSNENNVKP